MAVLVGQEGEGSAAAIVATAEIPFANREEVKATGTVEVLHVKLSEAFTGKVDLAIMTDSGELEVPGAVKQEAQVVLAAETEAKVTITGVAVTKGEFVWLAFECLTAGKFKPGTTG